MTCGAASLVGWYVSSQLRSALSPELTVTSHRGSLGESPTVVTILILKVARNIARMGKTLIQGYRGRCEFSPTTASEHEATSMLLLLLLLVKSFIVKS